MVPPAYPAAGLVRRLVAYRSDLGRQLSAAADRPLRAYLRSLFDGGRPRSEPWLGLLLEALSRTLREQGRADADEVCAEFARAPVLQQSDHSNLLLDAETFLNNYLFHLAAGEAGRPVAVTSQCSTVVCFSYRDPPTGPVFLRTRDALLNVFGLSKTAYRRSSFCALPGPLTIRFDVLEGRLPAADPVLGVLAGRRHAGAPDAYRIANEEIWRRLPVGGGAARVQVDERMTSEAVALHLRDPASPVHRLLFDPALRDEFLRTKREVVGSSRNIVINRAEPDWFWHRRGPRLHPVLLRGSGDAAAFTVGTGGEPLPVPYAPADLAGALRRGDLFADRVLSYLVRCLLPGAVAVGGTVQQDYVDAYRLILLETHRRQPFLGDAELRVARRTDLSRLGGAPLLEPDADGLALLAGLGPGSDLAGWTGGWLDRPVGITTGRLDCAWFYEHNLRKVDERRSRETGGERGAP